MDVQVYNAALTLLSLIANNIGVRSFLHRAHSPHAQHIPLAEEPSAYYVRRERKDRQRVINVFSQDGEKVYTIERKTQASPIWSMLEFPSRKEIATIRAGLMDRAVDFHNKPGLQHREMVSTMGITGSSRKFYLNDGASYEWVRPTKFLERIVNPGGGDEEQRERVAKARLMRPFRFDWELLVDCKKIDPQVCIATAFISMLTQWGLGNTTGTRGPTPLSGQAHEGKSERDAEKDAGLRAVTHQPLDIENRVYLVIENPDGTTSDITEMAHLHRQAYAPGITVPLKQLVLPDERVTELSGDHGKTLEALPDSCPVIDAA